MCLNISNCISLKFELYLSSMGVCGQGREFSGCITSRHSWPGVGRTSHNHQHFNEGALGVEFSTITCLDASSGPAEITVDKVVISVTSID